MEVILVKVIRDFKYSNRLWGIFFVIRDFVVNMVLVSYNKEDVGLCLCFWGVILGFGFG